MFIQFCCSSSWEDACSSLEKATIKKPSELNVPNDVFQAKFGKDWQTVLDSGEVFNALDGCAELGVDAEGIPASAQRTISIFPHNRQLPKRIQ